MSLWLEPASSISGFLTDDDFNAEVLESRSKRVDLVDFASCRSPPHNPDIILGFMLVADTY